MMMLLIERSECDDDDDVSDRKIKMWWWWYPDDDDAILIEISEYDDEDVLIERSKYDVDVLIERSEYDDDDVFWSKDQSVMMMFLIERSEYDDDDVSDRKIKVWCWRCCCWSKGQSAEDVAADRKVKLLLIEVVKVLMLLKIEDWRWRLHDVEKASNDL